MEEPNVAIATFKGKLGEEPLLDRYIIEDLIPLLEDEMDEWSNDVFENNLAQLHGF